MRNTGPARFFIPAGIILIIVGIILLGFNTDKYVETTGKIKSVTEYPYEEGEPQAYDLKVSFSVDGKEYETTFANLTGSFKEGDDIKVFYDPSDPEKTTNSKMGGFIAPILIVAGAAALIYGIFKAVAAFRKSKALDAATGDFPTAAFEGIKSAPGVTEYYFCFDGHSLKPGYIVEDGNRNVVYEGKMTKQALVGARTYEFVNHMTGSSRTHEIGHTTTQTYDDGIFTAKSWFKFDGKNVWDVIHDGGVRISTNHLSKFPYCVYDVAKNGAAFARVESCGVYVHEDDEAQHAVSIPTGSMYYRFWTSSNDFDLLFLTIFAISETEQAVVE